MYPVGFGLPIWSPAPVEIGSFGFFQDGEFKYLDVNTLEGDDNQLFLSSERSHMPKHERSDSIIPSARQVGAFP
jgi:hypothetical protein